MNTFTMIILVAFVAQLSAQFTWSIEKSLGKMLWFGFEIMAFAYLAKYFFF